MMEDYQSQSITAPLSHHCNTPPSPSTWVLSPAPVILIDSMLSAGTLIESQIKINLAGLLPLHCIFDKDKSRTLL